MFYFIILVCSMWLHLSVNAYCPADKICCNGRPFDVKPWHECCGGQYADFRHTLCCLDTVYPIGDTTACCGVDIYTAHTQTCCGGEITDNVPQLYSVCCAGRAYDKRQVACLNGVPTSKCARKVAGGQGSQASGEGVNYDVRKRTCCEGRLHSLKVNRECCGSRYLPVNACVDRRPVSKALLCSGEKYIAAEKHCCDGYLHRRVAGNRCCRSMYYNPGTQRCIQGSVVDIEASGPMCRGNPYSPSRHRCCDDRKLHLKRTGFTCCGAEYISPNKYTRCEEGKVVMLRRAKVCKSKVPAGKKNTVEERKKYICCDGKLFRKRITRKCCGNKYVSVFNECNSKVVQGKQTGNDGSGVGIGTSSARDTSRCGNRVYTIGERVCCGEGSLYVVREGFACCGTRYYRTSSDYYCSPEEHLERRATCAVGVTYDSAGQVCCRPPASVLRKAANDKKKGKNYPEENLKPKVYTKAKSFRCCGRLYIDISRFYCHRGTPKERTGSYSQENNGGQGSDEYGLTGLGIGIPTDESGLLGLADDLSGMGLDLQTILEYLRGLGVDTSGLDISGALDIDGIDWSGLQLEEHDDDDDDDDGGSEEGHSKSKSGSKENKSNKKGKRKIKKKTKKSKKNNKSSKNKSKDRS